MKVVGERIIAYLKQDATLVTLLGSANNVFAANVQERKDKYVVVSYEPGKDGNNIPSQEGNFTVECIVSRTVANAHLICVNIAKRVDDLLNKHEDIVSSAEWKIIHLMREGSSGLLVDADSQEFYFSVDYQYLLDESVS